MRPTRTVSLLFASQRACEREVYKYSKLDCPTALRPVRNRERKKLQHINKTKITFRTRNNTPSSECWVDVCVCVINTFARMWMRDVWPKNPHCSRKRTVRKTPVALRWKIVASSDKRAHTHTHIYGRFVWDTCTQHTKARNRRPPAHFLQTNTHDDVRIGKIRDGCYASRGRGVLWVGGARIVLDFKAPRDLKIKCSEVHTLTAFVMDDNTSAIYGVGRLDCDTIALECSMQTFPNKMIYAYMCNANVPPRWSLPRIRDQMKRAISIFPPSYIIKVHHTGSAILYTDWWGECN